MKNAEFWAVELCVRMGPLALGTEYDSQLQILRDHGIEVDCLIPDRTGKLPVPDIHTQLLFSDTNPRTLERIDVEDDRLRFGSLPVIGKRIHEIIGIFKISRKQTLWCSIDFWDTLWQHDSHHDTPTRIRQQLASGTIWIPSLGLGLTLKDGLVAKVHLCEPSKAPRTGDGQWTKEQQLLSEVRELPAISTFPNKPSRTFAPGAVISVLITTLIAILFWWLFRTPPE